jgi:hypothetical protein
MPSSKLNILQRGILQKVAVAAVYFSCFLVGGYFIDWLEKRRFATAVEEARKQDLMSLEDVGSLKSLISGMDETAGFALVIMILICALASWFLMRWAANLNLAWSVTLPKVVEFRYAMDKLGIKASNKQISAVRDYKLSVFIALKPLFPGEHEAVSVKLYPFAHDSPFSTDTVFERHAGKQTLCLNSEDYEHFAKEFTQDALQESFAAVVAKNEEITGLKRTIVSLSQENAELTKERDELRGKVRMQPAQEEGRVDRLRVERLLWIAYTAVLEKMLREAPVEKQYTTPEIESAFAAEWEQRADLREHMRNLTGNETANPSTDFLKAVKAEFKVVGKLSLGGRPKKNP